MDKGLVFEKGMNGAGDTLVALVDELETLWVHMSCQAGSQEVVLVLGCQESNTLENTCSEINNFHPNRSVMIARNCLHID